MAVVQNPIVGRAKNKFGNAIFSTWKGKNVLRTKPLEVRNPRSPGQVAQRNRLSEIVAMYRASKQAIDVGYKQQAVGRTEYNAFVADNMQFITADINTGILTTDYTKILYAKGTLPPSELTIGAATATQVTITFSDDPADFIDGQTVNDVFSYVAMKVNTANGDVVSHSVGVDVATRGDGTAIISLDNAIDLGTETYIWLFFSSPNYNKSSDSVFAELVQA